MQLLTTTGYKDIEDCVIGEQLVAYDINDGHEIINILEGKEKWTYDMLPPEVDDDGNVIKTSEQVFQDTYGDWTFYLINGTWTLFWGQSVWANMNVTNAEFLQVGDIVYDDQDNDVVITSIQVVSAPEWWRLKVSGDHSYIADNLTLHNASRYWVGGGSANTWVATGNTNWGSASGGANNASVPTSVDDVIFDGAGTNGNTASTLTATTTILSYVVTAGYTATATFNASTTLNVNGTFTFGANMTVSASSTSIINLSITAPITVTFNGKTWGGDFQFPVRNQTYTILTNMIVSGKVVFGTNAPITINQTTNETITCNGLAANGASATGTIKFILTGGTWNNCSVGGCKVDLQGNVTISGANVGCTGNLTYVSGTITTTGSTLSTGGSAIINTSGVTWNNVSFTTAGTCTLASNLVVAGLLGVGGATCIVNRTTTETITTSGGFVANSAISGTAEIIITGGTWSAGSSAGTVANNLTFNGSSTVSGNVYYQTGILKYTSGTITTTGSTLNIVGSCTLNTTGITWANVTASGTITITLTSNFLMTGLFTVNGATTLNTTTTQTWTTSGGMTVNVGSLAGTAKIILTGGTWTGTSTSGTANSVDLAGNVTLSSSGIYYKTGTLSYVSGTITVTGSNIVLIGSCTINSNGLAWNSIYFSLSSTLTLTSNLVANGLVTINNISSINKTASETFTCNAGLTVNQQLNGSAEIILTGGTWSAGSSSGTVTANLTFNGNVTVSGNVYYQTNTLKYTSGTITTTGSTLNITFSCTLNTNGITWNAFSITIASTVTLTSDLNVSANINIAANATINTTTTQVVNAYGGLTANALLSGTAPLYFRGGTFWSVNNLTTISNPIYIQGNVTLGGTASPYLVLGGTNSILSWISGTVTFGPNVASLGVFSIYLQGNITLDTKGITFTNFQVLGTATITLQSDLNVGGLFYTGGVTTINKTNTEVVNLYGGLSTFNPCTTNTDINLYGGTWSCGSSSGYVISNINLYGGTTISGTIYIGNSGASSMVAKYTGMGGNVKVANNASLVIRYCTIIGFYKIPFVTVTLQFTTQATVDELFTGTANRPCRITASLAQNIQLNFLDSNEKIARFVNFNYVQFARRLQVVGNNINPINAVKTNTFTSQGIRYGNQSPNGFPKKEITSADTMGYSVQGNMLGLVNDPSFLKQF